MESGTCSISGAPSMPPSTQAFTRPLKALFIVGGCIEFQEREVHLKFDEFRPVTGRHFPLDVRLNLAAGVTAAVKTLPQALGLTAEQDDAVNLQKMGEMTVHQPPTVGGRLPSFAKR
ncbi:MAG: hypothetical protein CM15mP78_03190 [Candidatus Poseidoniales archaeon]|nr:MAG: hypothetical protein CM15mP78_03190 [Candidatus Poseidoniales archaeon]